MFNVRQGRGSPDSLTRRLRPTTRSSVEGEFLDPVEAAADERELLARKQMRLHPELLAVEFAVEHEAVRCRLVEADAG